MTFAMSINLVTIILCLAVLVQSVRMMRSIDRIQGAELGQLVTALDRATGQAHIVLDELKVTLTGDARNCVQRLSESKEIHEELGVLVGIANAMAERIVDAADDARKLCAKTEQQVAASKPKARSRTSRPSKNDNVVDAAGDASELRAQTEKPVAASKPKARSRTSRPSKNDNVADAAGDASELRAKTEKPVAAGKPKARSRTSGPRKNGNNARKTKTVAKAETAKVLTV